MKNLKKLNRAQQRQINGGAITRCSNPTRPCSIGWCCNGICSPIACIDPEL